MTLPLLSRKSNLLRASALAVAMAAASMSANAALTEFSFDPSAAGLNGTAYTADNWLISNYSVITFGADNTFTETGYLTISAAQLGGSAVLPEGLNSTYGLYIQFTGSGTLTQNGNPGTTATFGSLSSLSYTLYGYNGTASFGVTGTTPTETATGEIALAQGTLNWGTVATIPAGNGTAFNPSANASLSIEWLQPVASSTSGSPLNVALTSFSNTTSQVTPIDGGFIIQQGGGSINFATAVPEPSTYAMLISGLAAVGFVARRRNSRGQK